MPQKDKLAIHIYSISFLNDEIIYREEICTHI